MKRDSLIPEGDSGPADSGEEAPLISHYTSAGSPADGAVSAHTRAKDKSFLFTMLSVCAIGFFVNCQPSEPFLTMYLENVKNITDHDLDTYVWPTDTYSSFLFLLPVGLLAEVFGYKQVIFVGLLCREATRLILLFGKGVTWMAFMQVTYAASTSVDAIYFAYVYMIVPTKDYARATAYIHAASHAGEAIGSGIGQAIVSYGGHDARHLITLFYVSWGFTSLGLACFCLLPRPVYDPPPSLVRLVRQHGWRSVLAEAREMYRHPRVIDWSLWWLLGYAAKNIVINYYQNQFYDVEVKTRGHSTGSSFGTIELILEFFSSLGSLCTLFVREEMNGLTPFLLTLGPTALGVLYYFSTIFQSSLYITYVLNVVAIALDALLLAVASAVIANCIKTPRYAIIFTFNSFLALGLATIVQAIISAVDSRTTVYYRATSGLEWGLVVTYLALTLYRLVSRGSSSRPMTHSANTDMVLNAGSEEEMREKSLRSPPLS